MDDIYELVTNKIDERILGRELDPFIDDLLQDNFHKFMVMLVLKEGPGSNAWKQAINTIDVLLWTVEPKIHEGDSDRLDTVNPRLFNNLRKAFRIAKVDAEKIEELMDGLVRIQESSFPEESKPEVPAEAKKSETSPTSTTEEAKESTQEPDEKKVRFLKAGEDEMDEEPSESLEQPEATLKDSQEKDLEIDIALDSPPDELTDTESIEVKVEGETETPPTEPETTAEADANDEMSADDPHMKQVDELSVGMWVEFAGDEDANTRCKLAAKINAIDKFIFVNRQGVKVVEKTKLGLARELRDGTVSIISDGLLFSRALESVIGNLRENQIEQQTGSAYQPDQPESESESASS
jgi:hypothetical protein